MKTPNSEKTGLRNRGSGIETPGSQNPGTRTRFSLRDPSAAPQVPNLEKQSQSKADGPNTFIINRIGQRIGETKPGGLSSMPSVVYSDFKADFREVSTDRRISLLPIWGLGPTNPNKPKLAKALGINGMTEKSAKQTQRTYHTLYQLLTTILAPISGRLGWKGCASLSGIWAQAAAGRVGWSRCATGEFGVERRDSGPGIRRKTRAGYEQARAGVVESEGPRGRMRIELNGIVTAEVALSRARWDGEA